MKFFSLLFLGFFLFTNAAHARVCIDAGTIESVAGLFSQQKKKEPTYQVHPRQRVIQEKPQVEVPAYLGDGVYVVKDPDQLQPPPGQDLYAASRAGLRDSYARTREPQRRIPNRAVRAPSHSQTVQGRSKTPATSSGGTVKSKRPSRTLSQTLTSTLGSAGCSGICF